MDGQRLRFRLVGINNQNFVMQDAQTGSWWQQVTGRAIAGPLKGKQLTLVPHDEVAFGRWKAYPLDALRQSRVLLDTVGDVPLMVAVAEDGRSVRVFDRRVGEVYEFVATPSDRLTLTDLETMSEWDFSGRATSGPLAGRTLARIPFLLEYWFDWQTYQPSTDVYKPWRPVERTQDRFDI